MMKDFVESYMLDHCSMLELFAFLSVIF